MQTHLASNRQHADLADDVLVQQAHLGDHGAFEMLVDRYSALLLRLISHLVRDEHLAHDVVQHVFLQLYRSLPTLRTEGMLKGWLCQVGVSISNSEFCTLSKTGGLTDFLMRLHKRIEGEVYPPARSFLVSISLRMLV